MNQFLPTNLTFESTIHVGKYTTHGQQPSKTCSTPLVGSLKVRKMGHVLHISSSIGIAQAIIADLIHLPIESMYVIYTYIWLIFMVNVGKYTIHGLFGLVSSCSFAILCFSTKCESLVLMSVSNTAGSQEHCEVSANASVVVRKPYLKKH